MSIAPFPREPPAAVVVGYPISGPLAGSAESGRAEQDNENLGSLGAGAAGRRAAQGHLPGPPVERRRPGRLHLRDLPDRQRAGLPERAVHHLRPAARHRGGSGRAAERRRPGARRPGGLPGLRGAGLPAGRHAAAGRRDRPAARRRADTAAVRPLHGRGPGRPPAAGLPRHRLAARPPRQSPGRRDRPARQRPGRAAPHRTLGHGRRHLVAGHLPLAPQPHRRPAPAQLEPAQHVRLLVLAVPP